MRFRTGVVVGLAVGYYLGLRAGTDRLGQLEEWIERLRAAGWERLSSCLASDEQATAHDPAGRLVPDCRRRPSRSRATATTAGGDPRFN